MLKEEGLRRYEPAEIAGGVSEHMEAALDSGAFPVAWISCVNGAHAHSGQLGLS